MNHSFYLIAGLGITGRSIARYLKKRNLSFAFFDTRHTVDNMDSFNSEFPNVDIFFQTLPAQLYSKLTTVITSPGVALDSPIMAEIKAHNIPIIGDIECLVQNVRQPIIAITGTNGKSTVTTLVGKMAKQAGLNAAVGGNIGLPVLELLDNSEAYNIWVLELSSFQLDTTESLAAVGASILNISADHLDRHHTIENYIGVKKKIYDNAKNIVYNRDDKLTYPAVKPSFSSATSFGLSTPKTGEWGIIQKNKTVYLAFGSECLLDVEHMGLKGKYNWLNALAACALADTVGIDHHVMVRVLNSFSGLEHRCQRVRTLEGVEWINDSKGTNIGATNSAIEGIGSTIEGKIILIAGGLGKGADFSELKDRVSDYVTTVVLIGRDAPKIAEALQTVTIIVQANSLSEAITIAQKKAQPGDVVLFSPACASQDMFRDFNHRGEVFTHLVNQL